MISPFQWRQARIKNACKPFWHGPEILNALKLKSMKNFFILLAISFSLFHSVSFAEENSIEDIHFMIAPVVGYQWLERSNPYSHTEGVLTYGARVVLGNYRLAGEAEIQYGTASETFPQTTTITTTYWQARVGPRTLVPLVEDASLIFRAGLEAYRYYDTINANGVVSTPSNSWTYEPYVGTGVIFFLFKSLTLSVEEVYVLDTAWETSVGFRIFI
jgi:hypothetical protein